MAELLHAGAFTATAVSACCVAASGRRVRVRELVLAVIMLVAMADVVLRWGLLVPVGWAALLLATVLVSAAVRGRSARRSGGRHAGAMDALGAILMAVLLLLMSGGTTDAAGHAGHGVSSSALAWGVGLACAAFAAASVVMSVRMELPRSIVPAPMRALRRTAPVAMAVSIVLMTAVALG